MRSTSARCPCCRARSSARGSTRGPARRRRRALGDRLTRGVSLACERLPPFVDLPHFDELEAQRLDLTEHAVQRRLVLDLAAQNRLDGLNLGVEAVEAREQPFGQPSTDAELVPARLHRGTVEPRRVTEPHPERMGHSAWAFSQSSCELCSVTQEV